LIIHKPSLGSRNVPHKIWAWSVQPFWRLLDTNKQTDKPNLYIEDERKFLLFIDRTMINLLILENKAKTGPGWTCCNPTAFKFQRKPFWTKNAHNTQKTLFFKVQNYWISVETFQKDPIIINDLFDSLVNTMLDSIWGGIIVNGDTPGHF